jgi:hypothetical protein
MYGLKRIAATCVAIAVTALLAQPVVRNLGIISAHAQNAMSRGDYVKKPTDARNKAILCSDAPKPSCGGPAPSCIEFSVCKITANTRPTRVCRKWKCDIKLN